MWEELAGQVAHLDQLFYLVTRLSENALCTDQLLDNAITILQSFHEVVLRHVLTSEQYPYKMPNYLELLPRQ